MNDFPIRYDMPLFRPPSEGRSLILQVTLGCSWNRCSFCEMYTSKTFRPRAQQDVLDEIDQVARRYTGIRKLFLADGNAMVLSNRRLVPILEAIRRRFPDVRQVSSYALPGDVLRKADEELRELAEHGLNMIYVGVESGDDEVLNRVNKGETMQSSIAALQRAGQAGIKRSVMILNGLGGRLLSQQHARNTAHVLNESQPEFASTLVVSFPTGDNRFRQAFGDGFEPLDQLELFAEIHELLRHCELENTVFRSNHASNYLPLAGILNEDRDRLLALLEQAISRPGTVPLRQEWQRGL